MGLQKLPRTKSLGSEGSEHGLAGPEFEVELTAALGGVRRSLAETLDEIGATPDSSPALAKRLKLNRTLSWRLAKIVGDTEPFHAIQLLPGRAALDGLMKNLKAAGASGKNLDRMRDSLDAFDGVVRRHCGDRDTLEMMLSHRNNDPAQRERAENLRRLSFRGNSAAWGVQARVQVGAHFISPSADSDALLDAATVSGFVDFRRLRSDATWTVGRAANLFDDGTVRPGQTTQPIAPLPDGADGAPLLAQFCSNPLPPMRAIRSSDGDFRYELAEGPVGIAAAVTFFSGWVDRAAIPRYRQASDARGELYMSMSTPAEVAIFDVFFHHSMDEARHPEITVYSQLPGGPVYPRCDIDAGKMPLHERLMDLGQGPPDVVTAEVAHYPKLIDHVFERLGWDPKDFRGFRLKIRYPSIPTLGIIRYPLPDAPAEK